MKQPAIHSTHQRGQAIVLIAMLMVALIASLGLAVDGGGMFLLHRDIQNATDAAGLSAAYALCTEHNPVEAGERIAALNGFSNSSPGQSVQINHPPVINTEHAGDDTKVEVIITAEKPSYFIQVVYAAPLVIQARTIGYCEGSTSGGSVSNVPDQYAFRSLAEPGQCTQSAAWNVAGTHWTIEGDVWMPTIQGNVEFSSNQPDPEIKNNPIDILGNIYVGSSPSASFNNNHNANNINEDLNTSAATAISGYTGYGGDGVIDYNVPAPAPLPYTMDYFRPTGSPLCTNGTECGALNRLLGSDYRDISHACDHGWVNHQDFGQNSASFGGYYNDATNEWEAGVYYSTCPIALNDNNMRGDVTFISEQQMDLSNAPYTFIGYEGQPVFVSNKDSSNGNVQQCTSGQYAIQLNADNSYLQGPIVAFRGRIAIQGNGFLLESCISARGFSQNGNSGAIYRCVPGESEPPAPIKNFGLVE